MPHKILDTDVMVLQRVGSKPFIPENYPPPDGAGVGYPNLAYDMDIFHFKGEDLYFSISEYNKASGDFVLKKGDVMSGNLAIELDELNPAQLTLKGKSNSLSPHSQIIFDNGNSSSGAATQKIQAVHATDGSNDHIKINQKFSVGTNGRVYVGGRYIFANDGKGGNTQDGGGFLAYGDATVWNPNTGFIAGGDQGSTVRLRWTNYGGALKNSNQKDVLQWKANEVRFHKPSDGSYIGGYTDTDMYTEGAIGSANAITNKRYVDTQDGKYIPLGGTRDTVEGSQSRSDVNGPIDFIEGGYLNGVTGATLQLKYNNTNYVGIGGDPATTSIDNKIHFKKNLKMNNLEIESVKYPTNIHILGNKDANDSEKSYAARKEYVDDQDDKLQAQLDSVIGIQAPVGMINAYVGDDDPVGWFICDGRDIGECEAALGRPNGALIQLRTLLGSDKLPELSGAFLAQKKQTRSSRTVNGVEVDLPGTKSGGDNVGSSLLSHLDNRTAEPDSWAITMKPHNHTMAEDPGHYHRYGSNSTMIGSAGNSGYKTWQSGTKTSTSTAGAHTHTINNKTSEVASTTWDNYTRPQTYTINWIIKYDNG